MAALEGRLITAGSGAEGDRVTLRDDSAQWRSAVDAVTVQLRQLLSLRSENVGRAGYGHADMIFKVFVSISTVGLLALGLVFFTSWRLTAVLRRRILALRQDAQELQERLPDVVARLERGEDVDVDAEVRRLEPTPGRARRARAGAQPGQPQRRPHRRAAGRTAPRLPADAPAHRPAHPDPHRPAAEEAGRAGAQARGPGGPGGPVRPGPSHRPAAPLRGEPGDPRRRPAAAPLAQAGRGCSTCCAPRKARSQDYRRIPIDVDERVLARRARGGTAGPRPGGAHGERHRLLQAADPGRGAGRAGRPGPRRGDRGPRPGHGARAVRRRQRPDAVAAAARRDGPRRRRAARPVRGRPALREPGPPGRAAAVGVRRHPGHRAGSRNRWWWPARARYPSPAAAPHGGPPGRRRSAAAPAQRDGRPRPSRGRVSCRPAPEDVRWRPSPAPRRGRRTGTGTATVRPARPAAPAGTPGQPGRRAQSPGGPGPSQADQETRSRADQPRRSGATIGAFQRQSRRRRTGDDALADPARATSSRAQSGPTTEDR